MLTPCEVAVKTVSPAIRALLAQTLTMKHQMKEKQVADILGITQSAVSKYNNKIRGTTIPLENLAEIQPIADQMIALLLSNPVPQHEIMALFCQACTLIRSKGLMCQLCQQNQKPEIKDCSFCNNNDT
jgi:predicted transcriptional regulator